MKATKTEMKKYTIEELENYVARTDEKFRKAPKFIRRTSFTRWPGNRAAILREIDTRVAGTA